jgi:RNA polymerase sigma-70 factor (ECF subfamily)
MTNEPDSELIQKSLDGDNSAFAELIARYQEKVYATIISHIKNFSDAQDLTQDVFLTAYMKPGGLRNHNSFSHWIHKIAVNRCRIYRIEKRRINQAEEAYGEVLTASSTAPAEREPTQVDLWTALSRLPDDQRLILTLFHLEKQSYQEIANFLEIPRTTVQTRLRYARRALRKEIINLMKKELQSNRLPEGFPEDTVKSARELTELLMGTVPTKLINFIRQPFADRNRVRSQIFTAFYDSLTSEQKEAMRNKERKLHFTDLTIDQQVYLKQAAHQMWMWEIANLIVNPPFYISALEDCKFTLEGGPGEGEAVMTIRQEIPQPDGRMGLNSTSFGV